MTRPRKPRPPRAIDETFERAVKAAKPVGFTAGFQSQGDAPIIMNAGQVACDDPAPIPEDAQWHIGSISKTFTAVLIMMLVEEGAFSLDSDLKALLPTQSAQMHASWHPITLGELLSHTSGMHANPTAKQLEAGRNGMTCDAVLAAQWTKPLKASAGKYRYSNLGYMLLGHIIETHTGQEWLDVVRTRIAAPLGMTSLGIGPPPVIRGHARRFWSRKSMAPDSPHADNPPFMNAAGRLHASAQDMLTFGRFLLDARAGRSQILSAQSAQTMMTPVARTYGLGLASFPLKSVEGEIWGHDGSNTMWLALLAIVPQSNTVAFFASNEGRQRAFYKAVLPLATAYLGQRDAGK